MNCITAITVCYTIPPLRCPTPGWRPEAISRRPTNFEEREGQFSPEGKWIAYQSNETGRFEIYVQPFPGPGGKWQISTNGGTQVRWRRDGKELFCIGLADRLTAVPVQVASNGQAVEAGSRSRCL